MAGDKGTLRVFGPNETTELRILDAGLREVAAGTGYLEVQLDPGIYRAWARVPGDRAERLVALDAGRTAEVGVFDLRADSPVPLPDVRSSNRVHQEAAHRVSLHTHAVVGRQPTARLFLFARTEGPSTEGGSRPYLPGFAVRTRERELVASFPEVGEHDVASGWLGLAVDLPAGTYILEQQTPGLGSRAQAIFVEDGWETQVFAPWRAIPDFAVANAYIFGRGSGFDPNRAREYRRTEAALGGLARGRLVMAPPAIDDYLFATFMSPMLGLIASYAILGQLLPVWTVRRSGQPAYGDETPEVQVQESQQRINPMRLQQVATVLRALLPHSPDAVLISLLVDTLLARSDRWPPPLPAGGWPTFDVPPLFAPGTEYVMRLAAEVDEVCPADSWLAHVAPHLTTGSAWTRWDAEAQWSPGEFLRQLHAKGDPLLAEPSARSIVDIAREVGLPRSMVGRALDRSSP